MRERLDTLLTEMLDGNVSRFVWLRQFEVGNNSAGASRLLDRLEFLQALDMSPEILADVPPHRVTRLRRQGERYFADGLRDITSDRRLAILSGLMVSFCPQPEQTRYGERVSTGFVESTVNTVVGKRFCKRQQMRWSKTGAHLMLQTRTRTLDGTLRDKFEQWHPGMKDSNQTKCAT